MYAFLRGVVIEKTENSLVIDVNDIGYEVMMSDYSLFDIEPGMELSCFTRLMVQEDEISLVGFITREERAVFDSLVSVSGVGKRSALRILSSASAEMIVAMIIEEDYAKLTKLPSIGKKTAARLVVELRDKFKKLYGGSVTVKTKSDEPVITSRDEDVIMALSSLGFSKPEITRMMQGLDKDMTVEEAISYALKKKR